MKTHELFEEIPYRGEVGQVWAAPQRQPVFVYIDLSGFDPELDEENEAYRIFDKLGGRGSEVVSVDDGTVGGRVKFDSVQQAKQGLRILRRLSRARPRFTIDGTSSSFHTGSTDRDPTE